MDWITENWETIDYLRKSGKSWQQVMDAMDCCVTRSYLIQHYKADSRYSKKVDRVPLSHALIRFYQHVDLTVLDIMRRTGHSRHLINKLCKKHGIVLRMNKSGPAVKNAPKTNLADVINPNHNIVCLQKVRNEKKNKGESIEVGDGGKSLFRGVSNDIRQLINGKWGANNA